MKMHKFDFSYRYGEQDIPYSVWLSEGTQTIKTILFLGLAQLGHVAEHVASICPPGIAIVEGASHWNAADDGHDVPAYVSNYAYCSLQRVIDEFELGEVDIIAESQAAASIVIALAHSDYIENVRNIVLVQPHGLNRSAFGADPDAMIHELRRRTLRNARHQVRPLLTDKSLRTSHRQLLKYANLNDPASRARYVAGLDYGTVDDLRVVASSHRTRIVCGEKDELFPPSEITDNLRANDIYVDVSIVPGVPHSPLGTRLGQRLLAEALIGHYA